MHAPYFDQVGIALPVLQLFVSVRLGLASTVFHPILVGKIRRYSSQLHAAFYRRSVCLRHCVCKKHGFLVGTFCLKVAEG